MIRAKYEKPFFQQNITRWYNVQKNKRVFLDDDHHDPNDDHHNDDHYDDNCEKKNKNKRSLRNFSVSYSFNLIPQGTVEYQKRHQLSAADWKKIFKGMNVNHMWMMAIYYGLEVTTCAIQSANLQADVMKYGGNTQYKLKLENYLQSRVSNTDRLIGAKDKHKPPLPVHFVTQAVLNSIPKPARAYSYLLKWKDIYLVPFEYYNGYIKMVSVIPRTVYEAVYSKAKNLISQPFEYLVDGVVYSATAEYLLLQTMENHDKLLNQMDNHESKIYERLLYNPGTIVTTI